MIVESTRQNVPDRIILKAMRAALLAVLGLTVTMVGVLVHASGVTEDPRRPSVRAPRERERLRGESKLYLISVISK